MQLLMEPSIKATAAHIAFSAPSRSAVDAFFTAALKAGGRVHGEPAVRDQETGYYSAAILDSDDNSIEAMHRERLQERSNRSDVSKEDQRVLYWQKDVALSSAGDATQAEKPISRIMINSIATPTTFVSPFGPTTGGHGETSAKALVGTLLGAAAGAVVAYAMTKGEAEGLRSPQTQTITYQTIEANNPQRTQSVASSRRSYPPSNSSHARRTTLRKLEYPIFPGSATGRSELLETTSSTKRLPGPAVTAGMLLASTLIDTFVPPSEIRPFPPYPIARSHTDSLIGSSQAVSGPSKMSRASSAVKTVIQSDRRSSSRSPAVTEIRLAGDVPLPVGGATSHVSRHSTARQPHDLDSKIEPGSVAPSDSVSQMGPRKSRGSKRSSHHSGNRTGLEAVEEDRVSRVSEKTVRERGSRSRRRRESAISLPMRPISKASVHRSVKSFVPGL